MPSPSNPTDSSRSRLITALLLAFATLWCVYWFVHAWHYWEDDAYIHLEFARSLATGQGFAFNGHVVAGDTAPLWVFLLVGAHALIPNWLIAGKVLAALATLFGLAAAYAFARRIAAALLPNLPESNWLPAALIVLIVANPYFCYWAFSGMEPLAAAGVAFCAVLLATRDQPSIPALLSASLLAGLGPLLRPEMIFLAVLLTLPLFAQWRRRFAIATSPSNLASVAVGLLLLCAPLALWSLYSLHAFGHLIPNTNAAKRAGPGDSVLLHLLGIYALGLPLILFGLLAGVADFLLRPSAVYNSFRKAISFAWARPLRNAEALSTPTSHTLPLAGWIFLLWPIIATLFYIADRTYVQTRYILTTAPGLTILVVLLLLSAFRSLGRAAYLAGLAAALAVSLVTVRPFLANKAYNDQIVDGLGHFMHDRLPPDAPVATYSIGEIAFVSQHPIIDTGGITRPGAVPYLNAPPAAMLQWARSQGAQYFIGDKPETNATLVYSGPQRFIGWTSHPGLYSTVNAIELWKLSGDAQAATAP